jgi:hypothetical protein
MNAKIFAISSSILILFFVIELIRRQKMTFKYSISWLGISLLALAFAVYDPLLSRLSALAGFELPSNFVFFLFLVFFTLLSLLSTLYINEQNSRTEALAQSLALLEYQFKELQANLPEQNQPSR